MSATSRGSDAPKAQSVSTRRLRKRELDRNAQRNARERTKNRIAYLERLVEDLRVENAGGRVSRLVEQLSEVTNERDELSKALQAIENVLRCTKQPLTNANVVAEDSSSSGKTDPRAESSPEAPNAAPDTPATTIPSDHSPKAEVPDDPIIPSDGACDCSAAKASTFPPPELNRWRFANEVLHSKPSLPDSILRLEDATAQDTPIRAMVEGWDAVEATGRLPPLWQKLRRIDEVLFSSCRKVERLAIMRLMHLLYRYHAGPTEERKADVPAWYFPRPSQDMAHSYAIDFFAWPGIRERFVFSQHRYCANEFWQLFAQSACFLWPYEFRDCYTYNVATGEYAVSTHFDTRIRDLNCWRMRSDMYERFPEFYSDIPAYEEVPASLPDPGQHRSSLELERKRLMEEEEQNRNISNWNEAQPMTPWPVDFPISTDDQTTAGMGPLDFFPVFYEYAAANLQNQSNATVGLG